MGDERHDDEHLYVHKYRDYTPITSYEDLEDKPKINGVELIGNKTAIELGLAASSQIPTKTSDLTNDSGFITSASLPTKTSDLTNDSGFITAADVPTKTSDLTNDSGFITSADLPTKTSDLTNDSGFITAADVPTKTSELTNDSGFITDTQLTNLYIIKSFFNTVAFTCPIANIITRIQTELNTVLNALGTNEYITLEQLIITNLVTLTPERKALLKKGDTVPTYRLQGMSFGTNELVFVDVNNARIVHFGTINDRPSADYNDDYASDTTPYSCTILYNKYQKGV